MCSPMFSLLQVVLCMSVVHTCRPVDGCSPEHVDPRTEGRDLHVRFAVDMRCTTACAIALAFACGVAVGMLATRGAPVAADGQSRRLASVGASSNRTLGQLLGLSPAIEAKVRRDMMLFSPGFKGLPPLRVHHASRSPLQDLFVGGRCARIESQSGVAILPAEQLVPPLPPLPRHVRARAHTACLLAALHNMMHVNGMLPLTYWGLGRGPNRKAVHDDDVISRVVRHEAVGSG